MKKLIGSMLLAVSLMTPLHAQTDKEILAKTIVRILQMHDYYLRNVDNISSFNRAKVNAHYREWAVVVEQSGKNATFEEMLLTMIIANKIEISLQHGMKQGND